MAYYFNYFPKTQYNPTNSPSNRKTITNLLFRLKLRDIIKNNIYSYYTVDVSDEDTLEILAHKYYGSSEYHWIIALANDIIDPQYDWPLNYTAFLNYINDKYGSRENAELQVHHYEKVIIRKDQGTGTIDETVVEIQKIDYDALASSSYEALTLSDDSTIEETITKRAVSAFDYETQLNNNKRSKKLIKSQYLPQILDEFTKIVSEA